MGFTITIYKLSQDIDQVSHHHPSEDQDHLLDLRVPLNKVIIVQDLKDPQTTLEVQGMMIPALTSIKEEVMTVQAHSQKDHPHFKEVHHHHLLSLPRLIK